MRTRADFIVIGAGIAGASVAYHLAAEQSVVLLERESQPGYHTTGRSAAVYTEIYGNELIRALTLASKPFFTNPPEEFSDSPMVTNRPLVMIGRDDQRASVRSLAKRARELVPSVELLEGEELRRAASMLRPDYAVSGVRDGNAGDIDVHAVHYGFWRGATRRGCRLCTGAEVVRARRDNGEWVVETPAGVFSAPVVINASGAWADEIATAFGAAPIGLVPKRRSAFIFEPAPKRPVDIWPIIIDVDEEFYFKPDAGKLLGSPADEIPSDPCDAQPEDIDIAIAIDRIVKAADFAIPRIESKWAGLRSFVADKSPVVGFDMEVEGFFWLAGQGGYGIQTSPALSRIAAALALGRPVPDDLKAFRIAADDLSPNRLAVKADGWTAPEIAR